MSAHATPPREVSEDPVLVRVSNASVGWGRTAVLSDVSFTLRAGDCLALAGPNGSGKSTLVRALLGLSPPISGAVERSLRWRAGYVSQREHVETLLRLRAEEVVSMAASTSAWLPFAGGRERDAAAREALDAVGMSGVSRHVFRDLSGGQRQRVVLARALASDPTVLVLDEPTNGLDLRAEKEILDLIRRLRNERRMACILVTHALHVVAREDLTVGLLHEGQVRFGPPAEILARERLEALYGEGVRIPDVSVRGKQASR